MASKVIYRPKPWASIILNSVFLGYVNYELYRVRKGTHPTLSPRLEAAGIYPRPKSDATDAEDKKPEEKRIEVLEKRDNPEESRGIGGVRWTNLNGVPIPSVEMLIRPFRKE